MDRCRAADADEAPFNGSQRSGAPLSLYRTYRWAAAPSGTAPWGVASSDTRGESSEGRGDAIPARGDSSDARGDRSEPRGDVGRGAYAPRGEGDALSCNRLDELTLRRGELSAAPLSTRGEAAGE